MVVANSVRGCPVFTLVAPRAFSTIVAHVARVYREQGTEWGGLLWGKRFIHPDVDGGVPVILAATNGVCKATIGTCEILPESWDLAERLFAERGYSGLTALGDYHSHPKMSVFMSSLDTPAFWGSGGHIPHWLSMVVDPWSRDYGVFSKDWRGEMQRTATYLAPVWVLRDLEVAHLVL